MTLSPTATMTRARSLLSVLVTCTAALAGCSSGYEKPAADQTYTPMVLPDYQARAGEKQETPTSCWAACVRSIQRFRGGPVETQSQINERIKGSARASTESEDGTPSDAADSPEVIAAAGQLEIMRALAPDARFGDLPTWDRLNKVFVSKSTSTERYVDPVTKRTRSRRVVDKNFRWDSALATSFNIAGLVNGMTATDADRLAAGMRMREPVVAGLGPPAGADGQMGHAVVVCGVEARATKTAVVDQVARQTRKWTDLPEMDGAYIIGRVLIMDPETGTVEPMDGEEFGSRAKFLLSRSSSKEMLEKMLKVVPTR